MLFIIVRFLDATLKRTEQKCKISQFFKSVVDLERRFAFRSGQTYAERAE
jgi:hypothetical protein